VKKIYNWIKKIARKNPTLFRVVLILIIILVVGILSASAATTGDVPDTDTINAAMGFVNDIYSDGWGDKMDMMKVQAYLIDIKDNGVVDGDWAQKIQDMGNQAIDSVKVYKNDSPGLQEVFNQLAKFGEELTKYTIEIIETSNGSSTNVILR